MTIPSALQTVFELLLWILLLFYILNKSGGVEVQVVNILDDMLVNTYMDIIVNSPNCLAYENISLDVKKYVDDSGKEWVVVNRFIKPVPGMIDLSKFGDEYHVSCLVFAEFGEELSDRGGDGYRELDGVYFPVKSERRPRKRFITYYLELRDLESGEVYKAVAGISRKKVLLTPARMHPELVGVNKTFFLLIPATALYTSPLSKSLNSK